MDTYIIYIYIYTFFFLFFFAGGSLKQNHIHRTFPAYRGHWWQWAAKGPRDPPVPGQKVPARLDRGPPKARPKAQRSFGFGFCAGATLFSVLKGKPRGHMHMYFLSKGLGVCQNGDLTPPPGIFCWIFLYTDTEKCTLRLT